jgi:hypothetical protein
MLEARELFDSLTTSVNIDGERWSAAIDALGSCHEAVTVCAAAMLSSEDRARTSAIQRDLDCADVTLATLRVLSRATGSDPTLLSAQLEACLLACERSHESCSAHAEHHRHCRICSQTTKQCADACRDLLAAVHH